ncbi:MAG: GGDEF domain-containing protein [Bacilli bacterium]|nr:GGDEF domain-containing protein [Bacilli bacterium]
MKKNNKINKIIILSIIGVILTVSLIIFILNYTKDSSSFSILEKNWINNNSNNIIDVSIYNDIPIYGQNGEGITFSYLEEFTNTYNIEFNKVSYTENNTENLKNVSFRILDFNTKLTDNDIEIYKDYYVIVSKNNDVLDNINDLKGIKLGVLDNDINNVKYYLNEASDITYVACKDVEEMLNKIRGNEIEYMAIPKTMYLDDILTNDLNIVYHLSELYKQYVMTVNKDKTLKSILNKYWMIYEKEYKEDKYREYFLDAIFNYENITEAEKMGYNGSAYTYGYVTNMPYENTINKEFVGTFSNYLSGFEDFADVDFKIVAYNSVEELKKAFSHGEVDLIFANFNTNGVNVDILKTNSPFEEEYVVLSKESLVVNTIRSLKGKEIYTVKNTYLYDFLNTNNIKTRGYNNTDDLLRNIRSDSIVILDRDTYEYYKNTKFKDYKIIYQNILTNDYSFVIRDVNKNNTFYKLFNYYVSDINYKNIKYMYNTDYIISSNKELNTIFKYLIVAIVSVLSFVLIIYLILKKKDKKQELKKEDKLKFIDVMTSLKNRNYLNYNIKSWDENIIYPQAIVIIDLNNVKYINDNYGHAEGDELIKKAASILIVNQKENTDIVRTDGNEFLIYMVGYDEKKVIEYTRKLNKELKELPHGFGATLGYSMIEDDIKTIDDAINEATLSMRQAKEKI